MSMESFLAKLEKNSTRTFILPSLQEEVTYKKMDVIEASINNSLPNFLASRVLDAMKKSVGGETIQEEKIKLEDEDIKQLLQRATEMWEKLVIEPKLNIEQIIEIPSEDRLAWFLNAIAESQKTETKGGGELNAVEVANFPRKRRNRRNTERSPDSEVL